MAWLNGICDNLVELDMANQVIKSETTILSSHFLICSLFLFASPLPPPASRFLPSPLYSLSLPASPHLPILSIYSTLCTEWRICSLILIPHTKGGWIISFLSHPAWIGPLRNSHAMAFFLKADCYPLSLIYSAAHSWSLAHLSLLLLVCRFHTQQSQSGHNSVWD